MARRQTHSVVQTKIIQLERSDRMGEEMSAQLRCVLLFYGSKTHSRLL